VVSAELILGAAVRGAKEESFKSGRVWLNAEGNANEPAGEIGGASARDPYKADLD